MTVAKSRTQIINEHLPTKKKRAALIASMTEVILQRIAYMSLVPRFCEHDPALDIDAYYLTSNQSYPLDHDKVLGTIERAVKNERAVDRVHHLVAQDLTDQTTKTLLGDLDLTPSDNPVPDGAYNCAVMNALTWAAMRKRGEMDPIPEDTIGGIPRYKGAQILPSKMVEPGIIVGVGPQEKVGRFNWILRLQDATETVKDQARTPKNIGISAELYLRLALEERPMVQTHAYPLY